MSVRFIPGIDARNISPTLEELNESKVLEKPNTVDPHAKNKRKYMS
jgi:hypothetical protein